MNANVWLQSLKKIRQSRILQTLSLVKKKRGWDSWWENNSGMKTKWRHHIALSSLTQITFPCEHTDGRNEDMERNKWDHNTRNLFTRLTELDILYGTRGCISLISLNLLLYNTPWPDTLLFYRFNNHRKTWDIDCVNEYLGTKLVADHDQDLTKSVQL